MTDVATERRTGLFGVEAEASFSADRRYRFQLVRRLTDNLSAFIDDCNDARCVFVMLNPSTADAFKSDPTITRCVGFAKDQGCGWLVVVNCYAWRSTDPAQMFLAETEGSDIVGQRNDEWIQAACRDAKLVICGWGKNARPQRAARVLDLIREAGARPMALGSNQDGSPKHPLYIRGGTQPEYL